MGDTPTGKVVAGAVPALVMTIALFMILEQLQIAPEIVRIAFAAVMFALALGLALAFGLGGREAAADLLNSAQAKGKDAVDQAKRDAEIGRQRAEHEYDDSSYGDARRAATRPAPCRTAGPPTGTSDAGGVVPPSRTRGAPDPHGSVRRRRPRGPPGSVGAGRSGGQAQLGRPGVRSRSSRAVSSGAGTGRPIQ